MKVFAYLRKSTEGDSDQIHSLTTQKRIVEEFAKKKGLEIDEYIEEDKTGFKAGVRKKFNAMMKEAITRAKRGEEVHILLWKVSRLGRNRKDAELALDADEAGVNFHFHEGDFPDNASGRKMLRDKLSDAIFYSEELSENVKVGQRTAVNMGLYPGNAKLGYLKRPDPLSPRKIDINEAWKIKQAFEKVASGEKTLEVIRWLQKGVNLKTYMGKIISHQTGYDMFRDRFFLGEFLWYGKWHKGKHLSIIPEDLFDAVQAILEGKSRPKKFSNEYLFSGMVFLNGVSLSATTNNGFKYYRDKIKKKYFTEKEIIDAFADFLKTFDITEEMLEEIRKEAMGDLEANMKELQTVRNEEMKKISEADSRILNAQKMLLDMKISPELYENLVRQVEVEKKIILQNLPRKEDPLESEQYQIIFRTMEKMRDLSTSFSSLPYSSMGRVIRLFLEKVEMNPKTRKPKFILTEEASELVELSKFKLGSPD